MRGGEPEQASLLCHRGGAGAAKDSGTKKAGNSRLLACSSGDIARWPQHATDPYRVNRQEWSNRVNDAGNRQDLNEARAEHFLDCRVNVFRSAQRSSRMVGCEGRFLRPRRVEDAERMLRNPPPMAPPVRIGNLPTVPAGRHDSANNLAQRDTDPIRKHHDHSQPNEKQHDERGQRNYGAQPGGVADASQPLGADGE